MKTLDVWGSMHGPVGRVGMVNGIRSGGIEISTYKWQMDSQGNYPGGPMIRTLYFHCQGPRFNPWSGN